MTRLLVLAYIFFVSWSGVFALSEWVRLPFLLALCTIISGFFGALRKNKIYGSVFKTEDFLIILFLIIYILSFVTNENKDALNYVYAYIFVMINLYLLIKGALFNFTKSHQIYIANSLGVIFVSLFLGVDFILNTLAIADIQNFLPRLREATATYGGGIRRGYAFSTEPGIVAYYLNVFGPLTLWFFWNELKLSVITKIIVSSIIFLGWGITFSAAGLVFIIISIVLAIVVSGSYIRRYILKYGSLFLLGSLILILLGPPVIVEEYLAPIIKKVTLSGEMHSVTHRVERLNAGVSMALERPLLGFGPRYFSARGESSTLNWYLMLIVESGLISFMLLMIFFIIVFFRIQKSSLPSKFPFMVGYFAGCLHLTVISTFYHPFLWLIIAMFYSVNEHHKMHMRKMVRQKLSPTCSAEEASAPGTYYA